MPQFFWVIVVKVTLLVLSLKKYSDFGQWRRSDVFIVNFEHISNNLEHIIVGRVIVSISWKSIITIIITIFTIVYNVYQILK